MENSNRIIKTKLLPPEIQPGLITRERLIKSFAGKPKWRAILVTAPAGYGKTVFVLQTVMMIKKPLVWYQLDTYDNDPAVFLRYLVTGFQPYYPNLETKVTPLFNKISINSREILSAMINELSANASNETLLVLDDFHFITDLVIHQLVHDLLFYIPGIKLLISSRLAFPSPFVKLSVNEGVHTVRADDLRFTKNEIKLLMNQKKITISDAETSGWEQKAAGWPAALYLLSKAAVKKNQTLTELNNEEIYNYLASEVLSEIPEEIRLFLIQTSVLDDLTPEFCDLLLHRDDSAQKIQFLLTHQLFLTPLTGAAKTYRYHRLFRDFLQKYLEPNQRRILLQRAGNYARQINNLDQAIEYFLAAGDYDEAAKIITPIGDEFIIRGYWQKDAHWLSTIPMEQFYRHPWLALLRSVIEYCHGTQSEAEKWINCALDQFKNKQDSEGVARATSFKVWILFSRGQYRESNKLLKSIPARNLNMLQFELPSIESLVIFFTIGRLDIAVNHLRKKLSEAEKQHKEYAIPHLARPLISLYYIQGDYSKAMEMHRKVVQTVKDPILVSYGIQNITTIYRDWGELDRALELAKQSVEIKEKFNFIALLPYAYCELADVLMELKELQQAEQYFRLSVKIAREIEGQRFFLTLSLARLARCLALQNRTIEAQTMIDKALTEARGQVKYVLAICQVTAGSIYIQTGRNAEGLKMLQKARKILARIEAGYPLCLCYGILTGILMPLKGKKPESLKNAVKCLRLASRGNYLQMFISHYDLLKPVLRFGLENNLEVSFIQSVLLRLGPPAIELMIELIDHPDPEVRRQLIAPLAEIGGTKVNQTIQPLLNDRNIEVRTAAQAISKQFVNDFITSQTGLPPLTIKSFGCFSVSVNNGENTSILWPTKKARDLFAYLVHQEKPVARERIIDEIWPDLDPKKAVQLFHTTLYQIRQSLSKICGNIEFIIYQNKEYQLAPNSFSSDQLCFKELTGLLPNLSRKLDHRTAEQLEAAVSLYQGDYLQELDYSWLHNEREHLKRLCSEVLKVLAEHYFELKQYSPAIKHLQFLVEENPLSEEFCSLLMIAYAETGDRFSVKKQYVILKKALHDELGLSPSPETRNLYYKLCGTGVYKRIAE